MPRKRPHPLVIEKRAKEPSTSERGTGEHGKSSQVKPSVTIIGAGRLGTALACALAACGYSISAVVTRRRQHSARAQALISARPPAFTFAQLDQLPESDLLLITTPDAAIAATASRLAQSFRKSSLSPTSSLSCNSSPGTMSPKQPIALHASGALSSEELADLRDVGFAVGSLHPLISVSDPLIGAKSLRRAFYCLEGEARAVRLAKRMVRDLGGHSFTIGASRKALYHAAAVMTSGHVVALFGFAAELLRDCGLTERTAHGVLVPLLRSTLENLSTQSPARALTGPFARADIATVRKHVAALSAAARSTQSIEDAVEVYTLLGRRSLQLAKQTNRNAVGLKEIARLLEEAQGKSSKKAKPT